MRINKLSIHPEKTEFMVIDHPRRQSKLPELQPFYLDNIRIKQVHKTKYLGLTVDDKLSWNEQYKFVKGKVVGGLASLRKLKNILPQSKLRKFDNCNSLMPWIQMPWMQRMVIVIDIFKEKS